MWIWIGIYLVVGVVFAIFNEVNYRRILKNPFCLVVKDSGKARVLEAIVMVIFWLPKLIKTL